MNTAKLPPKLRVFHVDDDAYELERVRNILQSSEKPLSATFVVDSFDSPDLFLERLNSTPKPDIVLLDFELGQKDLKGFNLTKHVQQKSEKTVVVVFSGYDDAKTISQCLNSGVDDFISKKSDKGELSLRIYQSYFLASYKRGNTEVSAEISASNETLAVGKTLEQINLRVPKILRSAVTSVHISGETGTGKEVVADLFATHLGKALPFVKVNCGAITPSLLESELFGHIKGAFTGASGDKRGLIEAASGGWIFLDEVATLSPTAQAALLRSIENQEIIRVGDNKPRKINVKFLSAANEPLSELVKRGRFRQDLWQRLCEIELSLPPLRERADEIDALTSMFLKNMPGGPYQISAPALEVICSASWKQGNVRELRNCLRAMTELNVDKMLTPLSIPKRVWDEMGDEKASEASGLDHATNVNQTGLKKCQLQLSWPKEKIADFDFLTDLLLLELTKVHGQSGKISLRSLAKNIGMSRSTLSTRLRGLVERQLISLENLSTLVGISDKTND